MSLIETLEGVLKSQVEQRIDFLVNLYGVSCKVYKVKENVFSTVYGKEAGEELSSPNEVRLVITNDTTVASDANSAGTFTEGWAYTNSHLVTVGDRIEIIRADGKSRKYKVDGEFNLGTSTSVMRKFKIVSLGD